MKKIHKKLTYDQYRRGVIFSSTLSEHTVEQSGDTIHEVFGTDEDKNEKIARLLDDKFFNRSHFKYNIIRNWSGT
jgi:hypothetical protein